MQESYHKSEYNARKRIRVQGTVRAPAGKIRDWKTVLARTAPQRNYGRMNLAAGSPLLGMDAGRADTELE